MTIIRYQKKTYFPMAPHFNFTVSPLTEMVVESINTTIVGFAVPVYSVEGKKEGINGHPDSIGHY